MTMTISIPTRTLTGNNLSRRAFLGFGTASVALFAAPAVFALNTAQARALVDKLVGEINSVINSGRPERQMYGDFERIFGRYADVPTIARSTLGPPARTASAAQMRTYTKAFQGYIARKYGKRFREFVGGRIIVQSASPWKSHFEVKASATLKGSAPFAIAFHVSDRSGKDLFFDMLIEGISLLKSEATEIGAMLDRHRGNIARLTEYLKSAG